MAHTPDHFWHFETNQLVNVYINLFTFYLTVKQFINPQRKCPNFMDFIN